MTGSGEALRALLLLATMVAMVAYAMAAASVTILIVEHFTT